MNFHSKLNSVKINDKMFQNSQKTFILGPFLGKYELLSKIHSYQFSQILVKYYFAKFQKKLMDSEILPFQTDLRTDLWMDKQAWIYRTLPACRGNKAAQSCFAMLCNTGWLAKSIFAYNLRFTQPQIKNVSYMQKLTLVHEKIQNSFTNTFKEKWKLADLW